MLIIFQMLGQTLNFGIVIEIVKGEAVTFFYSCFRDLIFQNGVGVMSLVDGGMKISGKAYLMNNLYASRSFIYTC
jgi:hypothetical protein